MQDFKLKYSWKYLSLQSKKSTAFQTTAGREHFI